MIIQLYTVNILILNTMQEDGMQWMQEPLYEIKVQERKYVMIKTDNCAISPSRTPIGLNETKHFVLYFPPIPPITKEIDFIECNDSSWKIYGIKLIH